jgi:phosphoribosylformylglycinamidine cyclo-ligase
MSIRRSLGLRKTLANKSRKQLGFGHGHATKTVRARMALVDTIEPSFHHGKAPDERLKRASAMLNLKFRPEFQPHPTRRDSSLPEAKKKPASVTYADAGVDISSGDRAKQRIKYLAQRTFSKNVLSEIGGFGGLFKLDTAKYTQPILVSSADGVGTKLKLAFELGIHHTVGADLVNHCVNDIGVQGATPLFFLDYLATGRLDGEVTEKIVIGLSDACRANGCALIGGETAQMPGFYKDGEYDLAGFIVGVVDREKLVTGAKIQPGDVLIGLPSTGLHTNGYSLARKLFFEVAGYKPEQYINAIKDKAGAALMKTHRSYLSIIQKLVAGELVEGMAHITGGGITENLPRILPKGLAAQVDLGSWPVLPIFEHLRELGNVEQEEMLRTFNMGVGLIAVVRAEKFKRVKGLLDRAGEKFHVIGRIVKGDRKVLYA